MTCLYIVLVYVLIVLCFYDHFLMLFCSEYYEKIVKELQTQSQTETITGLLLMYPKYCVHVIEVIALFLCFLFYYISVNLLDKLIMLLQQ